MVKRIVFLNIIVVFLMSFVTPGGAAAKPAAVERPEGLPETLAAEGISAESWAAMQDQMAAAQYHFTWQDSISGAGAYQAPNPEQGLGVGFGPGGVAVWPLAEEGDPFVFSLSTAAGASAEGGEFSVEKGLVSHLGNGLQETLQNTEDGIRYALTVEDASKAETLDLFYQLSGDLTPHLSGDVLMVPDASGYPVFQIGGLRALDAAGRVYPAVFALEGGGLAVHISGLTGARFPLTVVMKVWTEGVKLTASDAEADDQFGMSVVASGDVIVVGASYEDAGGTDAGAAYVFQRMQDGADAWGEIIKLTASDAESEDRFGTSVAASGDVIVVGAPFEDTHGTNAGAAYVFQRMADTPTPTADAWGEVVKLTASDAAEWDLFGSSAAVSGDVIVVGAGNEGSGGGAAYVYQRMHGGVDAWGEVTRLAISGVESGFHVGDSVGVSGDVIVVGAWGDTDGVPFTGAVYVFERMQGGADTWGQVARLTASDAAEYDYFGHSVAVSGDVIVAGAVGSDTEGTDAGAAYVFQRMQGGADAWGQVAKLTASDIAVGDEFGYAVAISGDVIVVGSKGDDDGGSNTGAAYVFHRLQGGADGWGKVAKLKASDAQTNDRFGESVAISGDVIVIGAIYKDTGATNAGAAYVFQDDAEDWRETAKNTASDAAADDQFGISVAVSGDVVVVGAPNEEENGTDAGAAYVFQRMQDSPTPSPDAWGEVTKLTASDAAAGDAFGISVAVSGDVIVVGAFQTGSGGGGAAYVFQRMQDTPTPSADAWGEVAKLTPSITNIDYRFGCAVAVSGDVIVVGAKRESVENYRAGAAYVFQRMEGGSDVWDEVARLTASDVGYDDRFGWSVAVSGDVIVVGAPNESSDAGAAYVFQRMEGGDDAWGEVQKLMASDAQANDHFGSTVAVSGDVIVVGANGENAEGTGAGAAYVFQRMQGGADSWGEVQKLTASDAAAEDHFGVRVAVSGDVIVVGAWGEDDGSTDAGAAYVFQRTQVTPDAWDEVQKLTASDAAAGDLFGFSTAISGDVIVIGARYGDASATITDTGAAYIFQPELPYADLSLTKAEGADPVYAGAALTYTLSVNNAGANEAENLTVTDTLPGGVTFQSASGDGWTCGEASGVVTCTRASLAVGDAPDITITVNAPSSAGDITNSATVTANTFDNDTTNNTDDTVTTIEASADLSLTKTDSPDPVYAGGMLTYTLAVNNAGPSEAANLTVTDTLLGGVTFQSASGGGWACGEASGVVTCTRATLAVGDAPDITITVTAPSSTGDITNSAGVTADSHDPASGNNTDDTITTVEASADLSLTKTEDADPVTIGGTLTYTLSVNNAGPSEAENLTVTDTLPAGVTFQSATGDGWACNEASGVVTCTRASLAVGDAPDIILTVTAPSSAGDITNSAVVASDTYDPVGTDNADDAITTIIQWDVYIPLVIR